jgi:hypothetical protein
MEDTGNCHNTELHQVTAFQKNTVIDTAEFIDDLYGSEAEQYYSEKFNINPELSF